MIVTDALDLWLSPQGLTFAQAARKGTWRTRVHLSVHIRRVLGQRHLNKLTAADVAHLQHDLRTGGMAVGSTNTTTHGVLLALLRDFEAIGKVRPAVRARVKFAPQLAAERSIKLSYYTMAQRDAAIVAFGRDRPLVAFLFLTGCRRGESAGLFRSDVDWQARSVVIERTRSREGGTTPCKTERSRRTIYLSDWAYDELLPLREGEPGAHLFLSPQGQPIDMETFATRTWHPTLKAAGLPRLSIHGTRHSWVTTALSLGVEIEDVAAQIGDTPETVRAVYDHVIRRFDPNAATRPPTSPPTALAVVAGRSASERPYLRLVR